mmetsp:Transcript_30169/g.45460  ORF Transcript_30169/g.45460 Transcript_30169/m.45460 type:complete len:247 (-) Transcript_30169:277-1017(-)|eukprot:CAMPEP_0194761930 /NCGR_PEP_ID=MMETSP0323_2-20130528/14540_1 /TAXON_ID=2866 ORGANISM="Crypthecodinium cohnii, Strain Seligo" /NCGR_SAMPLE_ID=MMETSP0323_2 /ASSEMBLY_ACC=CAM_ASM_000346 /LENGTH=246 /DNA_ID=CAMNT_0039683885 /DNA_START=58 /DNA_END=798 /DNA_ORIENTATION=+
MLVFPNGATANVKGGGKGKGGGKTLNDFEPACKVWIGGLPEGVSWKEVQSTFEMAGSKCAWAEVLGKGTGCVAYRTPEEAQIAIAALQGATIGGATVQVDAWTGKPGGGKGKGYSKGGFGGFGGGYTPVWQPQFMKGGMDFKGKGKGKGKNPLSRFEPAKKVWVGNVSPAVQWKELEGLFAPIGKPAWIEIFTKSGTACVCFKTEEEASASLGLTGSELGGQALVLDVWEQKPKDAPAAPPAVATA